MAPHKAPSVRCRAQTAAQNPSSAYLLHAGACRAQSSKVVGASSSCCPQHCCIGLEAASQACTCCRAPVGCLQGCQLHQLLLLLLLLLCLLLLLRLLLHLLLLAQLLLLCLLLQQELEVGLLHCLCLLLLLGLRGGPHTCKHLRCLLLLLHLLLRERNSSCCRTLLLLLLLCLLLLLLLCQGLLCLLLDHVHEVARLTDCLLLCSLLLGLLLALLQLLLLQDGLLLLLLLLQCRLLLLVLHVHGCTCCHHTRQPALHPAWVLDSLSRHEHGRKVVGRSTACVECTAAKHLLLLWCAGLHATCWRPSPVCLCQQCSQGVVRGCCPCAGGTLGSLHAYSTRLPHAT
jgi:hypothetical protein